MPLFKGRSSLLEVQNRALIKTARERAAQIEKLESDLQRLRESVAQSNKLERELQARLERQIDEIERLTLERDFYSKRALALEDHNRQLTDAATKYALWGQKLERELAGIDPDGAPARRFEAQQEP
jgi:peptidoglycan hydrolase CwlO-like protein